MTVTTATDVLADFEAYMAKLPELVEADVNDERFKGDPERAARWALAIQAAKRSKPAGPMEMATETLTNVLDGLLPRGGQLIEGIGHVEVKAGTKRTEWDHAQLVQHVIARLGDEPALLYDEEGTMVPPQEIVAKVIRRFLQVATPSWKLGDKRKGTPGLRDLGINPDEFCATSAGALRVVIEGAK